jgi:oligopeptide/dipeptide ABC transporter ATP-binding protein
MNALDPVYRVGTQIVEAIRAHDMCTRREAWGRAGHLFEVVGLEPSRLRHYPHQFSGGMRQRAIIAMALALDPPLIIADEPTTALDVIMQEQVFEEIERLQRHGRKALLLITHDIALVAENCVRIAVMYAGRIVETASSRDVFARPHHPYTIGLKNAFPNLRGESRELISIPGAPPTLLKPAPGCRFAPRCPFAQERCTREDPRLTTVGKDHLVACHFPEKVGEFRELGRRKSTWQREETPELAGLV